MKKVHEKAGVALKKAWEDEKTGRLRKKRNRELEEGR